MTPKGRSQSVRAVWTPTTSARGNPQNNAESPRTSRPSARRSSAWGAESGMRKAGYSDKYV